MSIRRCVTDERNERNPSRETGARHLNNLIKWQRGRRRVRATSQTFAFPSVVFLRMTLAPTRKDLFFRSGFIPIPSHSRGSCILIRPNRRLQAGKVTQRNKEQLLIMTRTAAQIRTAFSPPDRLTPGKSIDRSPKTRGSNPQMQRCSRQLHTIVARLPLDSARYLARERKRESSVAISNYSNYDMKEKKEHLPPID